ncbi:hypothetical protein EDC04DRAFT_2907948 [Pisolithus marmoratus]|nr:hypothetical protein EDC04DRAFT_2907948 [Pisolithus marmoratus]
MALSVFPDSGAPFPLSSPDGHTRTDTAALPNANASQLEMDFLLSYTHASTPWLNSNTQTPGTPTPHPLNHCDINAGIERKLLECGDFIKDGMDEEGHTNNFVHPALSTLIIKFFYTGTNAMVNVFPEVFQNEVPHSAVALATTAICFSL